MNEALVRDEKALQKAFIAFYCPSCLRIFYSPLDRSLGCF